MKRSRACEDLRALDRNSLTGQSLKRSKHHSCDNEELSDDSFLAAIGVDVPDAADALQFVLGMKATFERRRGSSSGFDECLPPIRRNSAVIECGAAATVQFKKKLAAESAGDVPEATAADLFCSRFQRETRCMDPLHPFEVSFYRLSINPNS